MHRPRNATDEQLRSWFDSMVSRDGPIQPHMTTPCWEWTGRLDDKGYGRTRYGGRNNHIGTHRLAWLLENGDPGSLCVLHRCDNPRCCRVYGHLFLGTKADNNADRSAKGRSATGSRNGAGNENMRRGDAHHFRLRPDSAPRGDKNGARLHPETRPRGDDHHMRRRPELVKHGVDNPRAKLTEDDVRSIRDLRASGETISSLSRRFKIGRTTIGHLLAGDTWTHVLPG